MSPRLGALAGLGLLLLTLLAWAGSDPARLPATAFWVCAAPLAAPLAGLLRERRRTARWAPLVLLPAVTLALTELVAQPAARWPAAAVLLAVLVALAGLLRLLRSPAVRD